MKHVKYIGSAKTDKNYLEMMFEYRGKTYFVTRALNWNCSTDYTLNKDKTERRQHENAQRAIDEMLDNPQTEIKPYNDTTEKALDDLFDFWNQ